jgi:hypothetical protein
MVQILNETSLLYICLSTLGGLIITAVTLWLQHRKIPSGSYVSSIFLPLLFTVIAAIGVLGMGGYYLWWRAMDTGKRLTGGVIMKQ